MPCGAKAPLFCLNVVFTSSSTLQPMQNPLFLLHFAECLPSRKYLLSDGVCTTHCSTDCGSDSKTSSAALKTLRTNGPSSVSSL